VLSAAAEELLSSSEELRSRQRKLTLIGASVLQSLQFCLLLSLRVHLQLCLLLLRRQHAVAVVVCLPLLLLQPQGLL
jgi:hypothetical protein